MTLRCFAIILFFTAGGVSLPAQYCADISYTESGGKLMVTASVNGKTGRFIFDTGAPCTLTHSFAEGMDMPEIGSVRTIDANGQVAENGVVEIGNLYTGGVNFRSVQAIVMEKGNMVERFGVDGIIGYTLFGDKTVQIDSRRQHIAIASDAARFGTDTMSCVVMLEGTPVPAFEIGLGTTAVDTVMLDTGAPNFYDLSEKTYARLHDSGVWQLLSRGRGILSLSATGLESNTLKYRVCIPSLSVGENNFARVTAQTTSGTESRLGVVFLRTGIVTLDYPNHRLYYASYTGKPLDLYTKEWNVVVTVMDNELKAGFVWESMWNSLDGGEKVVEINGRRFDKVDMWEAMSTGLAGLSGDEAEIVVIDRSGQEKRLVIKRE